MKTIFTSIVLTLFSFTTVFSQNDVVFDASDNWIAFMNWFELDGTTYVGGDVWSVADLKATPDVAANTLTLQPNFSVWGDGTDPFWVMNGEGAKVMEANVFVEPGAAFNGVDLTFSGAVASNTLDEAYTARFFIKALDPDGGFADALGGSAVMELPASGAFSVSVPGSSLPAGLIVQYGFSVTGVNANPANEAALGSIVISDMAVSVDDLGELENSIRVYPNPVTDLLNIDSESQVQSFQVSTLLGQTVLSGQAPNNNVEVSSLPAGTYIITVQVEEGQKAMKFFKR